jgi:hypothetical protein
MGVNPDLSCSLNCLYSHTYFCNTEHENTLIHVGKSGCFLGYVTTLMMVMSMGVTLYLGTAATYRPIVHPPGDI